MKSSSWFSLILNGIIALLVIGVIVYGIYRLWIWLAPRIKGGKLPKIANPAYILVPGIIVVIFIILFALPSHPRAKSAVADHTRATNDSNESEHETPSDIGYKHQPHSFPHRTVTLRNGEQTTLPATDARLSWHVEGYPYYLYTGTSESDAVRTRINKGDSVHVDYRTTFIKIKSLPGSTCTVNY